MAKSISKKSTSTPNNLKLSTTKQSETDSDDSLSFSDDDFSDSSDESFKYISKKLNLPTKPCSHQEAPQSNAVLISEMFPMRLEEFYNKFLSDNTNFFSEVCSASKCTDIVIPKWKLSEGGCCCYREVRFTIPVNHFLGPRTTKVSQLQRIRLNKPRTIEFETFSISHNVPYANDFVLEARWRIKEDAKTGFCWCNISWEVRWKSSVFFKTLIEKNALLGAKEYFDLLIITAKEKIRIDHHIDSTLIPTVPAAPNAVQSNLTTNAEDIIQPTIDESRPHPVVEVDDFQSPPTVRSQPTTFTSHFEERKMHSMKKREQRRLHNQSLMSNPVVSAPTPPPVNNALPPYLVLLIPVILFILLFPLVYFNGRLAVIKESLDTREMVQEKLEDRFAIVQTMLVAISKNITNVPGKTLREQWERHWSKEARISSLDYETLNDYWDERISFWERSFNFISNIFVTVILFSLKAVCLITFGIVVGLTIRYILAR